MRFISPSDSNSFLNLSPRWIFFLHQRAREIIGIFGNPRCCGRSCFRVRLRGPLLHLLQPSEVVEQFVTGLRDRIIDYCKLALGVVRRLLAAETLAVIEEIDRRRFRTGIGLAVVGPGRDPSRSVVTINGSDAFGVYRRHQVAEVVVIESGSPMARDIVERRADPNPDDIPVRAD